MRKEASFLKGRKLPALRLLDNLIYKGFAKEIQDESGSSQALSGTIFNCMCYGGLQRHIYKQTKTLLHVGR